MYKTILAALLALSATACASPMDQYRPNTQRLVTPHGPVYVRIEPEPVRVYYVKHYRSSYRPQYAPGRIFGKKIF